MCKDTGIEMTPDELARRSNVLPILACVWIVVSLIVVRVLIWPIQRSDFVYYFLPWQNYLIAHGRIHALQHPFSDYFPAYFELTSITSLLDGHLSRIGQLKILPLTFDLLAAGIAFRLVESLQAAHASLRQGMWPRVAALFVILAGPTVILNDTIGTADIVYASFLLLTVLLISNGRGAWASVAYGFAFAFKLQSIFLAPFYLALLIRRRVPLWSVPLVGLGWLLSLVPIVVVGGSPSAFLTRLSTQTGELNALAINVANPWEIANFLHVPFHAGLMAGLVIAAVAGLGIGLLGLAPGVDSPEAVTSLAALSLIAMPYVMPKMHDRYFFAGEILLSVLACLSMDYVLPAALVVSSSLICYTGYFMDIGRHTETPVAIGGTTIALYLVIQKVFRLLKEQPKQIPN